MDLALLRPLVTCCSLLSRSLLDRRPKSEREDNNNNNNNNNNYSSSNNYNNKFKSDSHHQRSTRNFVKKPKELHYRSKD